MQEKTAVRHTFNRSLFGCGQRQRCVEKAQLLYKGINTPETLNRKF
jgi:hypothetical protein